MTVKQHHRRSSALVLGALLSACTTAAAQIAPTSPSRVPASDPQHADATHGDQHITRLGGVTVSATAERDTAAALGKPRTTLEGERLDESRAATLGETVSGIPGVQSSNFGPGVGRPIIRGMEGPRVAVLAGGLDSQDVSTVSQDHAAAIEPFLADRIEVLEGPASLLYGSGAIGGAVNVVDGRIPEFPVDGGISGRAETRFQTGARHGNTTLARIDGGGEHHALHADAVYRHTRDYDTPLGVQRNTSLDTRSGALGGSLLGDWGFVGLAVERFEDAYGNPGEPGNPALGERGVHLRLHQDRQVLKGQLRDLWGRGNGLRFALAHTGYAHTEFEGDEIGTVFAKTANEGRLEATFGHAEGWEGALGLQLSATGFKASGEEAFVPETHTRAQGVFALVRRTRGQLRLDAGGRLDHVRIRATDGPERSFDTRSLSLAGAWTPAPRWQLRLAFDHAERAPGAEELVADGPHIATLAYEVGDPTLQREAVDQIEASVQYASPRLSARLTAYRNRFDGFIYLRDTGADWYWDEGDRLLPVRRWAQADALFRGLEGEATFHLARGDGGDWDMRLFGDRVRATLAGGGNLPRIAPARFGAQLRWERGQWRAALGALHVFRQSDVADGETATPGYTLVDAYAARHIDFAGLAWELFVDASNLTNQVARVHTSFLKDVVALPGRSFDLGLRLYF